MNSNSSIESKLSTIKYRPERVSHLGVDPEICGHCCEKSCVYVCPAGVWGVDENGQCTIEYENCLECGACRVACAQGAIEWRYSKGGYGMMYKQG